MIGEEEEEKLLFNPSQAHCSSWMTVCVFVYYSHWLRSIAKSKDMCQPTSSGSMTKGRDRPHPLSASTFCLHASESLPTCWNLLPE